MNNWIEANKPINWSQGPEANGLSVGQYKTLELVEKISVQMKFYETILIHYKN